MIQALTIMLAAVAALGTAQGAARPSLSMADLTVPPQHLPNGCALATAPSPNPLIGTEWQVIASIRERFERPPAVPDAQPLTRRELSRYRLALAEGVEEGYGAWYSSGEPDLIAVYALRFSVTATRSEFNDRPRGGIRINIGQVVVTLLGDRGVCARAIEEHLTALGNQVGR
jgi:hypothetical protein